MQLAADAAKRSEPGPGRAACRPGEHLPAARPAARPLLRRRPRTLRREARVAANTAYPARLAWAGGQPQAAARLLQQMPCLIVRCSGVRPRGLTRQAREPRPSSGSTVPAGPCQACCSMPSSSNELNQPSSSRRRPWRTRPTGTRPRPTHGCAPAGQPGDRVIPLAVTARTAQTPTRKSGADPDGRRQRRGTPASRRYRRHEARSPAGRHKPRSTKHL